MRLRVSYNRRVDPPVFVTTSPLPTGTVAVAYSLQMLFARGTLLGSVWALLSQTGTNGWVLSPGGLLTATPVNAEIDTLQIQLEDKIGDIIVGNFLLGVVSAPGNELIDSSGNVLIDFNGNILIGP